ncbi:MAG: hypothetical protein ACPHN2_20595 [Sinimarinibacterium flocculans]|uniref:hypothetical protein n=1 Tax=Sinimarinibacterium flocculans TaxID=985250 RepID=UPI003C333EE3
MTSRRTRAAALPLALTLPLVAGCAGGYADARRDALSPVRAEFDAADTDGDEALDREEVAAGMPKLLEVFAEVDTDGNGEMTAAELRSYLQWQRVLRLGPPRDGEDVRRRR